MKKLSKLFFVAAIVVSGCVNEVIGQEQEEGGYAVDSITATVENFRFDGGSKVSISSDGTFVWETGDLLNFWPSASDIYLGEPTPVCFRVEEGGSNTARFIGNGWGILRGSTYYASYPYSPDDSYNLVHLSYAGMNQSANASTAHLGAYDYQYSKVTVPSSGQASFVFSRLGALARFVITLPASKAESRFTTLKVKAQEKIFAQSASYDPAAEQISIKAEPVDELTLALNGAVGFTPEDGKIIAYVMMSPAKWQGKSITVSLTDADSNEYSDVFVPSKDQVSGGAYNCNVSLLPSYDLCEEGETANCYIVNGAGRYSFKAVKGNSSENVEAISSVEVLWESYGTAEVPEVGALVSDVRYQDGIIKFVAGDNKGNAVIAARNSAGRILWSWHIWLTDAPEDQEYGNGAGLMMDRNLGALGATAGDPLSFGLLYQWGRKDPFPGAAKASNLVSADQTPAATTIEWPSAVASTANTGTLTYSISHPSTFISYNSNNYDWYYSADATTDDSRWTAGEKSVYDPCPAGYMVPEGGEKGVWATACGSAAQWQNASLWNPVGCGCNFSTAFSEASSVWYPAAGYLYYDGGGLHYAGFGGRYWSSSTCGTNAYMLYFSSTGTVYPSYADERAGARSVRCFKAGSSDPEPVDGKVFYGKAIWHDALMSVIFDLSDCNLDLVCDVYVDNYRNPSVFYFDSPYNYANIASWFDSTPEEMEQYTGNWSRTTIELNAENPNKVVFDYQELGSCLSSTYGWVSAGFTHGGSYDSYGVYDASTQTITFAATGSRRVYWSMSSYNSGRVTNSKLSDDFVITITKGGTPSYPYVD